MTTKTDMHTSASSMTEKHAEDGKCQHSHVEGDYGDVGEVGMDPALYLKIIKVNEVSMAPPPEKCPLLTRPGPRQDWLDKLPLEAILLDWFRVRRIQLSSEPTLLTRKLHHGVLDGDAPGHCHDAGVC